MNCRRALGIAVALVVCLLPACATLPQAPAEGDVVLPAAAPEKEKAGLADRLREHAASAWDALEDDIDASRADHRNFYSAETLAEMAVALGVAAPLANTHADGDVRRWYQRHVLNEATHNVAGVVRYSGEFWLTVPLLLGADLAGDADGTVHAWGNRSLRAMLVGAPPLALLAPGLGAARPAKGDSDWRPFQHFSGVSGHTFVGTVPFLTAATLTDNFWLRSALVAGSLLPAWSRIDHDRHYLSQVILGWGLAWVAVASVDETENGRRWFRLLPGAPSGEPGVTLAVEY